MKKLLMVACLALGSVSVAHADGGGFGEADYSGADYNYSSRSYWSQRRGGGQPGCREGSSTIIWEQDYFSDSSHPVRYVCRGGRWYRAHR